MWRPEKFNARSISDRVLRNYKLAEISPNREHIAVLLVEAGADALLEALWKMAEESPTKTFTIDSRVINIYEAKNED